MTKYNDYWQRYQQQFQMQANRLAKELSAAYEKNPKAGDPTDVYGRLAQSGAAEFRDPWGHDLIFERARWDASKKYYLMRSAGPDGQLNTFDDLQAILLFQRKWIAGPPSPGSTRIDLNIEHDRGPMNGRAEIVGTVTDPTGAVVAGADVELRSGGSGKIRSATSDASGRFSFSALPEGDYAIQVTQQGFRTAAVALTLEVRDRAVLSAVLSIGQASEVVEVTGANVGVQTETAMLQAPGAAGVPGGAAGGVIGGALMEQRAANLPVNGRNFDRLENFAALKKDKGSAVLAKDGSGPPAAHVRSYFPEALYINPEIITDKDGRASIVIPMADSITTWRMAMIASTQQGALGTSTSSLKVFQDFFVDLDLPVTLTQGDRVSIPVAVYNYSGSRGDVNLRLQADDWFSLVEDSGEKSVAVDSARVGSSQFTLEARRIGKFKLTLAARMHGGTDRGNNDRADIVVREIEVIPNGREQSLVFNGRLKIRRNRNSRFPRIPFLRPVRFLCGSIPDL